MRRNEQEPVIQVGIMSARELNITFNGAYSSSIDEWDIEGKCLAVYSDGTIIMTGYLS